MKNRAFVWALYDMPSEKISRIRQRKNGRSTWGPFQSCRGCLDTTSGSPLKLKRQTIFSCANEWWYDVVVHLHTSRVPPHPTDRGKERGNVYRNWYYRRPLVVRVPMRDYFNNLRFGACFRRTVIDRVEQKLISIYSPLRWMWKSEKSSHREKRRMDKKVVYYH